MSRTRVRRRSRLAAAGLAVAAASVLAGPVGRAVSAPHAVPVAEHRYVVRAGDTLWSIATSVAPGSDPRPLVDAIASANAVDPGALTPGQTLLIPSV